MKNRFVSLVFSFFIFFVLFPQQGLWAEESTSPVKLEIGYVPHFGFAPFFLAKEKGYFSEQGLDVKLRRFRSGGHMLAPLSTGHLDVSFGRIGTDLFNSFHQKLDIKVVAGGSLSADAVFLVRKDLFDTGEITKPSDLKNHNIAVVTFRGLMEYSYAQILAPGNLTVEDVKFTALAFPKIPVAFANKAIDGSLIIYPIADQIINKQLGVELPNAELGKIQASLLYFGSRLLKPENRDVGIRFLVAYLKAMRDLQGKDWLNSEHAAIFDKYTRFPASKIRKDTPSPGFPVNGEIKRDSVMNQQMFHINQGYTEFKEPIPLEQIIDSSFLEEALKKVGKISKM